MNDRDPVPLVRRFSPVPMAEDASDGEDLSLPSSRFGSVGWAKLLEHARCVILAGAGAGKTFEMRARAEALCKEGKPAFFIRIEDIDVDFEDAFEVGDAELFGAWLTSQDRAYFFLDSVDESRLTSPRAFEKAIRRFGSRIKMGVHRAHVILSSRPYAWRSRSDLDLLKTYLPWDGSEEAPKGEAALPIFAIQDLDEGGIRVFAEHRGATGVPELMNELVRSDLLDYAGRPFDLEVILSKWGRDRALGSRLDLLRTSVIDYLGEIDPDRAELDPLDRTKAADGARRLAAAVVLTGEPGIRVPDGSHSSRGIDARAILTDWDDVLIARLLRRGLFSDPIYGMVRFRHREARELLAAEWFEGHLRRGRSRSEVEALLLRTQYGERIVVPRTRPVQPWLLLLDEDIRKKAAAVAPEIALEGGDVAHLPLIERTRILREVTERIAARMDDRSAQSNDAIVRIAAPDLASETSALLAAHPEHDDVLFFLGRLVWQGRMAACLPALRDVATSLDRGIYSRIVAVRAVMNIGTAAEAAALWDDLLRLEEDMPPRLLAEIARNASADLSTVQQLLRSFERLPAPDRREVTGLTRALCELVDRLPSGKAPLANLVEGIASLLGEPPFIERRNCAISERHARLLPVALRAIERLIENREAAALKSASLTVLGNAHAARQLRDEYGDDPSPRLKELVRAWPDLNDALFWREVAIQRTLLTEKDERLTTDGPVWPWWGTFWGFVPDDIPRILDMAFERSGTDDALVAVSLAYRIARQADAPGPSLDDVRAYLEDHPALAEHFDGLRAAPVSREWKAYRRRERKEKRRRDRKRAVESEHHQRWVEAVRTDPDRVRNPPSAGAGELTNDRYWLFEDVRKMEAEGGRWGGASWHLLVPEFGLEVAHAYRDAAMACWREYRPPLLSEGSKKSGTPIVLLFGLAGLEMEASQHSELFERLDQATVTHALRYPTWELNGFPTWLEAAHRSHPELVLDAVMQEVRHEFAQASEKPYHHIVHDLAYHAPWLHADLVDPLFEALEATTTLESSTLRYAIQIIRSGGAPSTRFSTLIDTLLAQAATPEAVSFLLGACIDVAPMGGIAALEARLSSMSDDDACELVQATLVSLVGSRRHEEGGPRYAAFETVEHLERLHLLAHRHIRREDDIDRRSGRVYRPGVRDDAQDARDELLSRLWQIPGKATYIALRRLEETHPDIAARPWIGVLARRRAEADGDLEPWTAGQVADFHKTQSLVPATTRQLFDASVASLRDLKDWVEKGDDSPFQMWRKSETEGELRNLFAGELKRRAQGRYTCAQENEVANAQRPDLYIQAPSVPFPVPIELKMLDKNWSGPKLCERLRNQLVGDYLREGDARSGIFLLVWAGGQPDRSWRIEGRKVGLSDLGAALEAYWASLSGAYPNVEAVEVVVIDLTAREARSEDLKG